MRKESEKYDDRLASLFNEIKESHIYKSAESGLLGGLKTEHGHIEIFNPWIKTLLFWKLFGGSTKRININSLHYRDCYIEGYLRGQFYFNDRFRNDPLETKDTIVINILEAEKRVKKYFKKMDLILSDKVFDDQGYNAGIYADILLFKKEKPAFFTKAHLDDSSQQIKPKKSKLEEVKPHQQGKTRKEASKLFKDLFISTELYKKALDILIENKYIRQGNDSLEWIHTPTTVQTTNQTIIALCVVLQKKGYFELNTKAIYTNIKNEFGIKIDKGNYSRSSNGFKDDYNKVYSTNYSYTLLFRDIL